MDFKMKREEGSKETDTTGHDRFYVERSRSYKKRRAVCRRARSELQLNTESIAAADRRNIFRFRSQSTEREESEEECEKAPLIGQKMESFARLLFHKSISGGSSTASPSNELIPATPGPAATAAVCVGGTSVLSAAAAAVCMEYLAHTNRYELIAYLKDIGCRADRHWFAVRDNSIKTERLLTLVSLGTRCALKPSARTRELILELFRSLQHPYIYPVLDVGFCSRHLLAVIPFNPSGSLKDLIYKSSWNEEYEKKYVSGSGLPFWQVGRVGRQLLEGLLFLRDKGFPPFTHLHSGNVILQNGVARISGLENTLVGARPPPACGRSVDAECLARVLYEMSCGEELVPDPRHETMLLSLEKYPQVLDVVEQVFGPRPPALHDLLACELFRKIDLRELKGSCLPSFNQRLSRSCVSLLEAVVRGGREGWPSPMAPMRFPR